MKKLAIIVAAVVVGLVLALVVLRIVGLDPQGRRAGLWLTGELVTEPVTDWTFTDRNPTILVETRTWYGIPHSVTTSCVAHNGQLYLTSVYPPGGQFPRDKFWNRNIMRDPRVRLKIETKVYDRIVSLVTDPAEKDPVLQTKAKKYPTQRASDPRNVYVFHVLPG